MPSPLRWARGWGRHRARLSAPLGRGTANTQKAAARRLHALHRHHLAPFMGGSGGDRRLCPRLRPGRAHRLCRRCADGRCRHVAGCLPAGQARDALRSGLPVRAPMSGQGAPSRPAGQEGDEQKGRVDSPADEKGAESPPRPLVIRVEELSPRPCPRRAGARHPRGPFPRSGGRSRRRSTSSNRRRGLAPARGRHPPGCRRRCSPAPHARRR